MSRIDIDTDDDGNKTIAIYHSAEHYDALIPMDQSKIESKNVDAKDAIIQSKPPPKRNKPCVCGSGLKFRDCCRKRSKKTDIDELVCKVGAIKL